MKLAKPIRCVLLLPASLALGACFGGGMSCEDVERYANDDSIPPLRIPDDLTVPDETETLLIPGSPGLVERSEAAPVQGCLESPPDFYGDDGNAPSA